MPRILFLSTLFLLLIASCSKDSLVDTSANSIEDINTLPDFEARIANGVSMMFFHASWCSICAEQRPAFENTAEKSAFDAVFFGEIEYEANTNINQTYVIGSFPTIVFYKDGVEESRLTGKGHSEATITSTLNSFL
jgi:thiol-disulfide isomerase/thioredoxin